MHTKVIKKVKTKIKKARKTLEQAKATNLKKENRMIAAYKRL